MWEPASTMTNPMASLEADFKKRPRWLQDAAARLLQKGAFSPEDTKQLCNLCKSEGAGEQPKFQPIPSGALSVADTSHALRLVKISNVQGVNALAPKKPLEFGPAPVTIIYGANGSGKSGYARMMKHACGVKNSPELHGNVFHATPTEPGCEFSYTLNGVAKSEKWSLKGGPIDDLRAVTIYDSLRAGIYINEENEITFEPGILKFFRLLVEISSTVDAALRQEIATQVSALPALPSQHSSTKAGTWYSALKPETDKTIIDTQCAWTPEDETTLADIQRRVSEKSPAEKSKAIKRTKENVDTLRAKLDSEHSLLNTDSFSSLQTAKTQAKQKREAANIEARKVAEGNLDGIGTETWKALWEAAQKYSETEAYRGHSFPHIGDVSKCVLCQQSLEKDAKERLQRFHGFVTGELERAASAAEATLKNIKETITQVITDESLAASLDAAAIEDDETRDLIKAFVKALNDRRGKFTEVEDEKQLPALPVNQISAKLLQIAADRSSQATALEKDAVSGQKTELLKSLAEANAKKWVSAQRAAIETEVSRLKVIDALEKAREKTNTKWLSDTKSALSKTLVTDSFIQRFETELKLLGASGIEVELVKSSAPKGQVFHRIRVKGAKRPAKPCDVLSEGQFRIVSIAAFIADIESRTSTMPIIFDDPVCSLDEDFEKTTARRLIALSKHRQVIVLTHRLSMVSLLRDAAGETDIDLTEIAVRNETWGAGEPGSTILSVHKPKGALKVLLAERLKMAREARDDPGQTVYEIHAKALCGELRIILERLIEVTLLADIVQRFRRKLNTKDKLKSLAKIRATDCELIDRLMTKYSFDLHSQPEETPGSIPPPEEIEKDLTELITWCEEFEKRPIPSPS